MFEYSYFKPNIDKIKEALIKDILKEEKYYKTICLLFNFSFVPVIFSAGYFIYWVIVYTFIKKTGFHEYVLFANIPLLIMILIKNSSEENQEILQKRKYRIDKAENDLGSINSILNNKQDFIFYLRDFAGSRQEQRNYRTVSASASGAPSPFASKMDYGKLSTQLAIEYFKGKYPLIFLDSSEDKTLFTDGYLIYPSNEQWFEVFTQILAYAKFIIIDYNFSNLTENIQKEIRSLIIKGEKKILFIGTEKDLLLVKSNYPSLYQLVYQFFEVKIEQHYDKETSIDFSGFNNQLN